jgi:type IV secretory pathway VirD2 relaxase
MMDQNDDRFAPRAGRIRNDASIAARGGFRAAVLIASRASGVSPHAAKASRLGRGRSAAIAAGLRSARRRVVVKFRSVRQSGLSAKAALAAHLSYLVRDGVSRNGSEAELFGASGEEPDRNEFAGRCGQDRHHFRCILSPEDADQLEDMRLTTRGLMHQMETDLGTGLDWVAIDHWNTDHPHVHVLIRGRDDRGNDLVINRDYIAHGMRSRAQALVEQELGPRNELAIRSALERDATAERLTGIDRMLRGLADERGALDLGQLAGNNGSSESQAVAKRLAKLERMQLASPLGGNRWIIVADLEQQLRDLGSRGDIIATMHRALARQSIDRGADLAIHEPGSSGGIVGRFVERGLHEELSGTAFAVVDGVDGRAHHIRMRDLAATGDGAPGAIVELRRFKDRQGREGEVLAVRSDLDVRAQVGAQGATWLDRQLVSREPSTVVEAGFGRDVRHALEDRAEHLVSQGLARRQGARLLFVRDLLGTLQQRELEAVSAKLQRETGLHPLLSAPEGRITGRFRQRLDLASGRFAMIEGGLGFRLVPWTPSLERHLGQDIAGTIGQDGRLEWSPARQRGIEI